MWRTEKKAIPYSTWSYQTDHDSVLHQCTIDLSVKAVFNMVGECNAIPSSKLHKSIERNNERRFWVMTVH